MDIICALVTSYESWNSYELTAIMAWCLPTFEKYSLKVEEYFSDELSNDIDPQPIHAILESLLDMLATLSKFEHVQKYILAYHGLEMLIGLFDVLEKNCLKIQFNKPSDISTISRSQSINTNNFKATNNLGNVVTDNELLQRRVTKKSINESNFPGCKCFLIEILAFMAYGQKDTQDKIRELHGLELVLSNCIIDDNNPFIKERSILCIRYLLADNQTNQDFISKLEAKTAVDDDSLEKAGYKVKVDGTGAIKLVHDERYSIESENILEQIHKKR